MPEVTTIVNAINRGRAQVAIGDDIYLLRGNGSITESVAGNLFTISPFSFFQTNTLQAEKLYEIALRAADLHGSERVWDSHCGAGAITLALAREAASILGIEMNEGAVEDARRNAARNGIANVDFVAGDMRTVMGSDATSEELIERPDLIITDPPRAGMHPDVVRRILEVEPARVVYVSCNPATQARDCAILAEKYDIMQLQPVDMFPQTYHVETVATLVRRESATEESATEGMPGEEEG